MGYLAKKGRPTVFYGICGEGLGHFSRSVFLISELLKNDYRVEIFTSRRVVELCRHKFAGCEVHAIPGMRLHYQNNSIHLPKTTWNNCQAIMQGPQALSLMLKRSRQCRVIAVISDYEPLVSITGAMMRLPVIAFDHQQIASECQLDKGIANVFDIGLWRFSNATTYIRPRVRIITSFFHPPLRKKRAERSRVLLPPVLRPEVLQQKTETGSHVLVYQTSRTMNNLKKILDLLPGEKRVYGVNKELSGQEEKPFNEQCFIKDLATCRFAVVNGGHTTLTEAIYLGKPVICFPVKGQAEQEVNGYYISKLQYGKSYGNLTPNEPLDFTDFYNNEESFRQNIRTNGNKCGNKQLVESVLECLHSSQ